MTVAKSPSMPFYGKDFFDDERVRLSSMTAWGLFLALLWRQWTEGSIPADVTSIAAVIGRPEREVRPTWEKEVAQFFAEFSAGRLANPKLERVRDDMSLLRQSRQQAGSKGGSKRDTSVQAKLIHSIADADASEDVFSPESFFDSVIWPKILSQGIPDPVGRKIARGHCVSSVLSLEDSNACLTALANYQASDRVKRGFIQNASTWFNNWRDWVNHKGPTPQIRSSAPTFIPAPRDES